MFVVLSFQLPCMLAHVAEEFSTSRHRPCAVPAQDLSSSGACALPSTALSVRNPQGVIGLGKYVVQALWRLRWESLQKDIVVLPQETALLGGRHFGVPPSDYHTLSHPP